MLSNQRGIIYQVTHDDMWQIIILTILFIAINVSNPPPRLPRSPLPPGKRSLQSQPHDRGPSGWKSWVAIQKGQSHI